MKLCWFTCTFLHYQLGSLGTLLLCYIKQLHFTGSIYISHWNSSHFPKLYKTSSSHAPSLLCSTSQNKSWFSKIRKEPHCGCTLVSPMCPRNLPSSNAVTGHLSLRFLLWQECFGVFILIKELLRTGKVFFGKILCFFSFWAAAASDPDAPEQEKKGYQKQQRGIINKM